MLLREMQIQNPTAIMIARTAVAQDDVTGCVPFYLDAFASYFSDFDNAFRYSKKLIHNRHDCRDGTSTIVLLIGANTNILYNLFY